MANEVNPTKDIPEKKPSVFTQEQKDELRQLIYANLTNYTDIMRVQSGVIESGNFVQDVSGWKLDSGGNADFSGTATANVFVDSTFGFNGVFVAQIKTTDYVSNPLVINVVDKKTGAQIKVGLMSVLANWYQTTTQRLNFLPGINNATGTSYYSIQKDGSGNYQVRHLGGNQGSELPNAGYTVYTLLFNSNETTVF